jgi:hypothetical protein
MWHSPDITPTFGPWPGFLYFYPTAPHGEGIPYLPPKGVLGNYVG